MGRSSHGLRELLGRLSVALLRVSFFFLFESPLIMRSSNEPILLLNKEPLKEKRYCGGRFTKIQWISLAIVFTVLLILVIALPIVYFVTIPNLIRV